MIVDPVEFDRKVEQQLLRLRIERDAKRALAAELAGPVFEPEMLTLRERLARPRPVSVPRIHRWQPENSRVLLSAAFKTGKTTLVGNYLRCNADGDQWLGANHTRATYGSIALLDFEMSAEMLDDWLGAQKIRRDDKVIAIPFRGRARAFDILDPMRRSEWAKRLKVAGVEVVILDCLRPVLDALGLDEHREAGQFLVAFDALLHEAEATDALVVHHHGHTGERARGDSRIVDWPDVVWKLVKQDDQPGSPRFLSAYGRDVDVPESQLAYDKQTRRLTLLGGSRHDAKVQAAVDAVRELLSGSDGMSGRAIKHALLDSEHSRDTIDAALRAGVQADQLHVIEGPRRSKLYRSVRVSGSVRAVSGVHSVDRVSECPAAFIEGGHSGHSTDQSSQREIPVSGPDTREARDAYRL